MEELLKMSQGRKLVPQLGILIKTFMFNADENGLVKELIE